MTKAQNIYVAAGMALLALSSNAMCQSGACAVRPPNGSDHSHPVNLLATVTQRIRSSTLSLPEPSRPAATNLSPPSPTMFPPWAMAISLKAPSSTTSPSMLDLFRFVRCAPCIEYDPRLTAILGKEFPEAAEASMGSNIHVVEFSQTADGRDLER